MFGYTGKGEAGIIGMKMNGNETRNNGGKRKIHSMDRRWFYQVERDKK